mgnify:CR=1
TTQHVVFVQTLFAHDVLKSQSPRLRQIYERHVLDASAVPYALRTERRYTRDEVWSTPHDTDTLSHMIECVLPIRRIHQLARESRTRAQFSEYRL